MSRFKGMAAQGLLLDVGDRVERLRVLEVIEPCHYTRARVKCDCGQELGGIKNEFLALSW